VYESFNWQHGVFIGASMRSEATAAAEHAGGNFTTLGYFCSLLFENGLFVDLRRTDATKLHKHTLKRCH